MELVKKFRPGSLYAVAAKSRGSSGLFEAFGKWIGEYFYPAPTPRRIRIAFGWPCSLCCRPGYIPGCIVAVPGDSGKR